MKTENYNLIEEDWIPVLMKDGSHRRVSLGDVFAHGDMIADLSMVAYERISVMRLLICIAMAALDERDLADEPAWRAARAKIPSAATTYFAEWHDKFNFYGPHAFMQPDGLTLGAAGKAAKIDKIVIAYSSGNNGTLFDHGAVSDAREIGDGERVLAMLSYENFSAGGQHPKCVWDGIETPVSVTAGPLREKNMVHTFICGENLLESVWLNLVTRSMIATLPQTDVGRPLWELEDLNRKTLGKGPVADTLCGRLVPLSRVMKFFPGKTTIALGCGLKYAGFPSARVIEAAVRMRTVSKGVLEPAYVSLSLEESVWRNLHAILARRAHHGALALGHLNPSAEGAFTVWSGGLLTDGKAKDIGVAEWRFTMPYSALEDAALDTYEKGVVFASDWSRSHLFIAAKTYCEEMKIDEVGVVVDRARQAFWDALEKRQPVLVKVVCGDGTMTDWERVVADAAKKAFERACPHQTGRQIAAYVQALGKLNFRNKEEVGK